MINKDGYLFLLHITPKKLIKSKDRDWVSKMLKLNPTGGNGIGDLIPATKVNLNKRYETWSWEYKTKWQKYWPSQNKLSFSENLLNFLKALPSDKRIWTQLSLYCECSIYIPVERSYFLIEIEFENNLWSELLKRNLRVEMSTFSSQININKDVKEKDNERRLHKKKAEGTSHNTASA